MRTGTAGLETVVAAPRRALHDIDWLRAVATVAWVPDAHRNPTVPVSTAMRVLRCTDRSFARLLDLGLPATPGADGPLFDAIDLKNVGLYSGSQVTEIEASMRFLLRYMRAGAEALTCPRRWHFQLRLARRAGPAEPRRVHAPTPEVFGGELHTLDGDDGTGFVTLRHGDEVTGTLTTRGADDPVRAPAIRAVFRELVDSGVRWQYLPASLEVRPLEALNLGAGNCAVLCDVLERRLVEAGFDARAYHGWMAEVPSVEHGWVEVLDEDGRTKCLDPSFALLAAVPGFEAPEFAELVAGSRLNRVVPTRARLHHPFVVDATDPGESVVFLGQPDGRPA